MKTSRYVLVPTLVTVLLIGAAFAQEKDVTTPEAQLRATETAFARTMAARDHAAFARFLSEEAVFFNGEEVLRGRQAVADAWARFFDEPDAPFSWTPEAVAILESGQLGMSSGPVLDPEGQRIGTLNSVWRRQADGRWRIVFDRGCPPCDCP